MRFKAREFVRALVDRRSVPALVVGSTVALHSGTAYADAYVFSNAADGIWSEPTNWTPTGVPGAGDTATIGDAAAARTVTYDAAAPATLGVVTLSEASAFANYLSLAISPTGFTSITVSKSAAAATATVRLADATGLTVGTGSTLQFGAGTTGDFGGTVLDRTGATPTGTLAVAGGTLLATSGNTTTTANYTVAAPATLSGGAINVVGPATGSAQTQLQFTGSSFTLSGGTVSIGSNANLILPATNTLSAAGAITISNGGTLTYGKKADQALLNAVSSASGTGFVLGSAGPSATSLDFTNAGNVSLGASANYTLGATTVITPKSNTFRFGGGTGILNIQQGVLTGAANSLVVAGGQVQIGSTGTATFGGSTTVNDGGVLFQTANNRLPVASLALTVNGTGQFLVGYNTGTTQTVQSLAGSGTVALYSGVLANNTLTVAGGTDTTFSGGINNNPVGGTNAFALGLSKTGASRLTLSGTNGYTGATAVSAGTLAVNGSVANSAFTVTGGTLAGTGLAGTTKTVAVNGGVIAAGDTAGNGTLSVGAFSLAAAATDSVVLNGTAAGQYSQISVANGGATLAGNLQLAVNYAAQVGDTFFILQEAVGNLNTITGTFANATPVLPVTTGTITSGGYTFDVSYLPTAVTLTVTTAATPEPAVLGLAGLGGLLLGRRRRSA